MATVLNMWRSWFHVEPTTRLWLLFKQCLETVDGLNYSMSVMNVRDLVWIASNAIRRNHLELLATHGDPSVRLAVRNNPCTPPDIIDSMKG